MKPRIIKCILLLLVFFIQMVGMSSSDQNASQSLVIDLELSFADPAWNGRIIPKGQQCQEWGGNGSSPPVKVKNIPVQANKLVIEFSDATFSLCDHGGHGIISYKIKKGTKETIIPSIPGQTFELPKNFELIKEHCGKDLNMKRGAYIGPCPGDGNQYYLTVKAVYEVPDKSKQNLLGKGSLKMGTYKY